MATADIDDIYFSSTAPDLKKRKIGVEGDPFSTQYAMGMYDEDVTTPKLGYDVPEIEEKEQEIDVPGGAEALDTDIESAAMLFTDEEKEEERKKLSKHVDSLGIQMQQLNRFSDEASKIRSEFTPARGIGVSTTPPVSPVGQGAADLGELGEEGVGEIPLSGDVYAPETGIETLVGEAREYAWDEVGKPIWEEAKDIYRDYFPKDPWGSTAEGIYSGGWTGTGYGSSVTGGGTMLPSAAAAGAGRSAAQIARGWEGTGYGAQAGAQAQAGAEAGAATWGSTAAQRLGQVASIYNIYQGIKEGGQGYVDAAMAASILATGGATAIPVAIIQGLRTLFGMRRRGKPKFPFGGTDFKTEGNKLKFQHPYGYNGFNGGVARAGAASVADYINTFVDHFSDPATGQGLQFSSSAWKNAVKNDPRLGRYDTMNDSGYADPSVLIRKMLEAPGVISGTPTVNGVRITDQGQYEQAMKNFNEYYTKTAMDRGGVANAQWLNTKEEPNMFGENWAGQYGEVPDQIKYRHRGDLIESKGFPFDDVYSWHYTHEDVKSPYDTLYYNITGKFNRGDGGMGY
jgi:hypothetical protein